MDYNALILGQSSAQCPTTRCAALTTFVETSRIFSRVHQESGSTAGTIPFIPDIVLLRVSGEYDARATVEYCRRRWNGASVMALFCRRWRPPGKDVRPFLNRVWPISLLSVARSGFFPSRRTSFAEPLAQSHFIFRSKAKGNAHRSAAGR